MDKNEEVKQWLEIAEGDLRTAQYILKMHHPRPDNIICNLCQQSAEKYLKGFLIQKSINFPKTHDIVALLELAKSFIPVDSITIDKCSYLTQFAVEPRYPNQREYVDEEVKRAIQYAKDIQTFIKEILQKETHNETEEKA